MSRSRPLVTGVALLAAIVCLASASRAATPAQKCLAVKLDAAARAVTAHASCQARALQTDKPVRAGCHESADGRLDTAFARVEARGGCAATGDEGAVDAAVDGLIADLLATQTPGRCGATKLRIAAQKAATELGCRRVAARRGSEPAPACLQKASVRFLDAFARTDKKGGCKATGDAAAVQALVDAFVGDVTALLLGTVAPTPTPSATATPVAAPANLAAVIDAANVALTWTPPDAASGNTHVRILRRLNAAPSDAADPAATVVFFGTVAATTDPLTALLPTTETGRTYHYAAFGCTAGGACESTGSRTTVAPTVRQVLLAGGYTIYFRHASASVCVDQTGLGTAATTMTPDWWKSCNADCGTATARQLDATGVTQATTIGAAFDTLALPVGRVVASEFCRTLTTAQLMDFGPTIETNQGISFFVYDEANRCSHANELLVEVPASGNTAVVGHAGFSNSCGVLSALAMGEGAIFKPDGTGMAVFITRVLPDGWATLP